MTQEQGETSTHAIDIEHLQELLRPIREAAAVWDIPLLEYLDSYLENISTLDLSKDFDPNMLNFSQAGLFLQGSTNVYAKKVKNLYDLVLNSTSNNSDKCGNDETDGDIKKRKRKVIEYIVDDKLAEIDDPVECDTTMKNDEEEETRIDITTMPNVPFCLLNSLETTQASGTSFRISNVPSQQSCVILLDNSTKFKEFQIMDKNQSNFDDNHSQIPSILDDEDEHLNFLKDSPFRQNSPFNAPPPSPQEFEEQTENNENNSQEYSNQKQNENQNGNENENDKINVGNVECESNSNFVDIPEPPDFEDHLQRGKYQKEEDEEIKFLDPNSQLDITSRPFQKMKKMCLPTTYFESKKQKSKISKKPFHVDIFSEIFYQVKKYRVKKMKEEDQQALEILIPAESGRDHILDDIDTYVEIPPPPPEDFFEEGEQLTQLDPNDSYFNTEIENPTDHNNYNADSYTIMCQNMIKQMVEDGQKHVMHSQTAEVLAKWESKVTPILENDRKHKEFFVTDVQDWVIDMLRTHNGKMNFTALVCNVANYEVSRIFLAVLMLANKGDVKLDDTNVQVTDDFPITLIEK
ncbi:hypothetical protein TRFO_27173 [Tritrichomonas foetus]|uniref:Condensin-2 complex subunit H2 C-terminal domain-containing protein n=1 Tax=Tritrichomonas foetus TaxID=1144522 RepID=A0A1J4K168_9EUKA|nr:hypothetical protein TRFO_27173 [Tritrichomonas foetus]|eukprot:OHT05169.1 hypothetical protein TRFO_27173 [Tritrichomonas foetus]